MRVLLLASCLLTTIWSQELKLDWAVYGDQNSKPELGPVEIKQGDRLHFKIASNFLIQGSLEPLPYSKPLAHVDWTVQPSTIGVSVMADGTVIVSSTARLGKYKVVAHAGNESRTCDFLIYAPQVVPLKGVWTQQGEIPCDGHEIAPKEPMRELVFFADGNFSATWIPFETRKDYWGSYTYDVKTEKLVLRVDEGNSYSSRDISPQGKARIDNQGRLLITGMWLGTPPFSRNGLSKAGAPKNFCGYDFVRPVPHHY